MTSRVVVVLLTLAAVVVGIGAYLARDGSRGERAGAVRPAEVASPSERMAPFFHLADPELRTTGADSATLTGPVRPAGRATGLRTATIANDTRYVLPGIDHEGLLYAEKVPVNPARSLRFHPALPPNLAHADRVLVRPQIKVAGKKRALPPFEAELGEEKGKRIAVVILDVPDLEPGSTIGVFAEAFAVGREAAEPYRTARVRIPDDAMLEVALGIAEPAWTQGAARFTVEACDGDACETILREDVDPSVEAGRAWQPRRISLAAMAGTERSFRFTAGSASWDPRALTLPLWGNPTLYAAAPPDDRPNVILLSIDTLGAEHVTSYGSMHDTTPFLTETFERGGVVFDHCVAAATTTPPSHMTMFTSLHPCAHKLQTGFEAIPDWVVTLAEILRGAGIETGAVTEDGWLGIRHGFGRGFNTYVENTSPDLMEPLGQIDLTFGKGRTWLEQHGSKRFFLFLHTFQVHDPYAPPAAYRDLYAKDAELEGAEKRPLRESIFYDREIRYMDDELRKLFAALEGMGLRERTVVILTSDHGEEFFEHGLWGHGGTLYQEVTRVPLMAVGPGVARGRRVATPVGHLDVMPTILALAGLPPSAQALGIDLSRTLADPERHPPPVRKLFSEAWAEVGHGPGYELVRFDRPGYMIQEGLQKLMRLRRENAFRYEHYDLATDPDERRNLYVAGAPGVAPLQTALDGYEDTCKTLADELARTAGASTEAVGTVPLSPEQEEKLRALGYLH